jgi:hypothetical protein
MPDAAKPPRLFWAVALLALSWNGFGAYDFLMTNARDATYVAAIPPAAMRQIDAMPLWAIAAWALGTWGAALGSILLLLRSRHAVYAFAASLAGLAVTTAYRASADMPVADPLTGAVWIVAGVLLWFALRMRRRGMLR